MKPQSYTELLRDATELLLDQSKEIQELIYWAVTLDDKARSAMIMAYRLLYDKNPQD